MKATLTDVFIRKHAPDRSRVIDTKVPRLSILFGSSGTKSWSLAYEPPGSRSSTNFWLGDYPAMSIADARDLARKLKFEIRNGIDPAHTKRVALAKGLADRANTMGQLAEQFIAAILARKDYKTVAQTVRILRRDIVPVIGAISLVDFHRTDLAMCVKAKWETPVAANRVQIHLKAMTHWATVQGFFENDPLGMITDRPFKEESRERVLNEDEIIQFWHKLDDAPMSKEIRLIFRLALVTGQRRGEVAGMKRSEIDLAKRTWTLPKARTKTRKTMEIHLSDLALSLIEEAMKDGIDDAIFVSRRGTNVSIVPESVSHALLMCNNLGHFSGGKAVKNGDPEHFTGHDLRRTMSTTMSEILKIDTVAIEESLNHMSAAKRGVAGKYNRNPFRDEKRDAFNAWGEYLMAITSGAAPTDGGQVLPFRRQG